MKPNYLIILLLCAGTTVKASFKPIADTSNRDTVKKTFTNITRPAAYPGGLPKFYSYIENKLKYPEVARLIGINGKVYVSFIVEKDGHIAHVAPVNCIGAGCEAEAVSVLENSKLWRPGMVDNQPVRMQYTVPINFTITKSDGLVAMKDLRNSDYGFIFQIKGNIYTIEQAEAILGKKFRSDQVQEAVVYEGEQYSMPDKKAVYIILIN